MTIEPKTAVIIGAGPAGLTAAYELLKRTSIVPVVLEASGCVGGISRTVNYKGNRIDIGGHRFFSKSNRVLKWWLDVLPIQDCGQRDGWRNETDRQLSVSLPRGVPQAHKDGVMLIRRRKSRILFLGKLFAYPIQLNVDTVRKLGIGRTIRIGVSYLKSLVWPCRNPRNLEEFLISRFGRELYLTFFKSYTEKVWGERCTGISPEWGTQRIKGLSLSRAIVHWLSRLCSYRSGLSCKQTETSLIEQFLYPERGPGQLWESVAARVAELGGRIVTHQHVKQICVEGNRVTAVRAEDPRTGQASLYHGHYVFSTMPVKELVQSLQFEVPQNVREVAEGLVYRDFITVGLLVNGLKVHNGGHHGVGPIDDNWIYIQEPDVLLGRLQVFNNWSPCMVADPTKTWLGLEYFCNECDSLWQRSDEGIVALAGEELERIGIIDRADVLDAVVVRMPKAYPAYFGAYDRFGTIREFLDRISNLWLMGRNGMHRYNNQDHSMLTAMVTVDNIIAGREDRSNIWGLNSEQEYHEEKEKQRPLRAPEQG